MRRIQRLSEDVINRIAAGEVVQRPSAALKELLENALDAGSASIQILVSDGGLGVLQVTDDGHGIHRDDLPLLCERYATSKLRCFEDLRGISSFGFRGEALSSISYVSRVTVTTMRKICSDEAALGQFAWRCHYVDGVMQGEPTPCGANPGTSIRVEKMFYNCAVRRRALNRPSEEYSRIVTVVSRYALAFPHVAFSCRRDDGGGSKTDIFFPKESTTLANIRLFYGSTIASNLIELRCAGGGGEDDKFSQAAVLAATGPAGEGRFLITGYTSGMGLINRKPYLCVFVNNRLVESTVIKRALDILYNGILTGGNRFFTVLFITIPPDRVDVNIHPTKHEVCILDEEIIVAQLSESVRLAVMESATHRQLDTRHILSKTVALNDHKTHVSQSSSSLFTVGGGTTVAPCTIVRVESQHGALDAYFQRVSTLTSKSADVVSLSNDKKDNGGETCDNLDLCAAVKLEEGANCQKEQQHMDLLDDLPLTPAAELPVSLVSSVMKLDVTNDGDGDIGKLLEVAKKDEDDEDEDVSYIMQQFKRQRREIQNAVGVTRDTGETVDVSEGVAEVTKGDEAKDTLHQSGTFAEGGGADEVLTDDREGLLLTSVATILAHISQATSPAVQLLFEKLVYVGIVNSRLFLAQSGTTLYALDTLRLVQLVVYQRIFLRWSFASLPAPPQLVLEEPVKVTDLLHFAHQHDVPSTSSVLSADETKQLIRRLGRRLCHWRCMLLEYFAIEITVDGYLVALPFGLNSSWPPPPRVVPIFIWRLATDVPYNGGEVECFSAIARHIAETLYGMRLHDTWLGPRCVPELSQPGEAANAGERGAVPSFAEAIRFGLVQCAASRKFFLPPADALSDGTVQAIVSVEELYKVFERC